MEKVSAPYSAGQLHGLPTAHKRFKTRIVSYTVVSNASRPIIRRRRVPDPPQHSYNGDNHKNTHTKDHTNNRNHQHYSTINSNHNHHHHHQHQQKPTNVSNNYHNSHHHHHHQQQQQPGKQQIQHPKQDVHPHAQPNLTHNHQHLHQRSRPNNHHHQQQHHHNQRAVSVYRHRHHQHHHHQQQQHLHHQHQHQHQDYDHYYNDSDELSEPRQPRGRRRGAPLCADEVEGEGDEEDEDDVDEGEWLDEEDYEGEEKRNQTERPSNWRSVRLNVSSRSLDSEFDETEELEALLGLPDHVMMYNKRDPVSVLMEYGQTREVKVKFTEMSRSGPHHASRFHTAAIVDDETHAQATGTSKKTAKKAAAILALRAMYDRGMAKLQRANATVNQELKDMESQYHNQQPYDDDEYDIDDYDDDNGDCDDGDPHQQPSADPRGRPAGPGVVGWPCLGTRVMHVSRRLLELAEETQFINYSKDKVLAAIVLEIRGTYTVVGLGTGNRCIQYQNVPSDGSRVIHSHAEIIARRAFIRYLLRELAGYRAGEKHALFTRSRLTGQLKLHDDIRVHLYISRPPCGDAAAFPTITNFPNRMRAIRKQGQLRTIIDDGEGAIPTEFQLPANANGKERLRVMTCSDKILRWNAVGVQGALLSNFLDPIYLTSLVIGSHTGDQRGHVPRAISGRLKCGRLHEVLMKPFRISSPDIVYPPHSDNYAITKSKQYCITWSEGDPDAEVLDAVSGSVAMEPADDSPSSRVSKRSLLGLFRQTCQNNAHLKADHLATLTYAEAKASARHYQRTKKSVEAHLQSCGFGQWLSLQTSYGVDNFKQAELKQD